MKVGLEESLDFLIEEQNLSIEKVVIIKDQLMDLADSLALNPMKDQREEYLQHLHQNHVKQSAFFHWHFVLCIYLLTASYSSLKV